jgi:hypothetical protein
MHATTATAMTTPPRWYWVVSWLALVWMLFGVVAWTMDLMTDEATVAGFTDAQRQLYAARPGWLFLVYAVAIFGGLAGTAGLLLRRSWSVAALAVSLAAVVVQFGYTLTVMRAIELLGAAAALPFPIVIAVIGALLLWLAIESRRRGWLAP